MVLCIFVLRDLLRWADSVLDYSTFLSACLSSHLCQAPEAIPKKGGSVLGLDRLAQEKRASKEKEEASAKRARMSIQGMCRFWVTGYSLSSGLDFSIVDGSKLWLRHTIVARNHILVLRSSFYLTPKWVEIVTGAHSPIRSYRYTVAMFPLPYKNELKYRSGTTWAAFPS
jgi:hypothetical protein